MLLGTRKNLYDHILEHLLEKEATAQNIKDHLLTYYPSVTMQGIYKGLRELMSEDIIVKQKQLYIVNNIWREKASAALIKKTPFRLSEGESVSYRFKKVLAFDSFWKHVITDIEKELPTFPMFHFTAHQFWFLVPGREQHERDYYRTLKEGGRHIYTVIGGATILDKEIQRSIQTSHHHVYLDQDVRLNRREHLSVIGNYVVISRISNSLMRSIDLAYETISDQPTLQVKLGQLFKNPGALTIFVEYNKNRATKLRKRLAADFHVPLELREKFDLF